MNSKQLQEKHLSLYETFFQKNEVVFSCPLTVNLSWDLLNNYAWLSIAQKIPLRMYIGLSFWDEGLGMWEITYYDKEIDSFTTMPTVDYSSYFWEIIKKIKEQFSRHNVRVNILSELSPLLGLGFTSIYIITLLFALYYYDDSLTLDDIIQRKNQPINDLLQDKVSIFKGMVSESIQLSNVIFNQWWLTTKLASFFDGDAPVVGFGDDMPIDLRSWVNAKSRHLYGFRINDLRPEIGSKCHFPYDFNIIYTGKPFVIEKVNDAQLDKLTYLDIKDSLHKKFNPICGQLSYNIQPKFFKNLLDQPNSSISKIYGDLTWSISLEVLYSLKEILWKYYSESSLASLIVALNKYSFAHYITRTSSSVFIDTIRRLSILLETHHQNIAIFPNETTISGWCVSIISPIESSRKKITKYAEWYRMQENKGHQPYLVYSSRSDGIETEWIKVEQDLRRDIRSQFCKNTNHKLINWDKTTFLKDRQAIIKDQNNDVIVDCSKNKIFIKWKIRTSKELHSQFTTVEIFSWLIKNNTKTISCKDLSPSSYTKNKNEMITKVIKPFIKLIEKEFGKTITITCIGSVSNYKMEFDLKDIKIGLLKEL